MATGTVVNDPLHSRFVLDVLDELGKEDEPAELLYRRNGRRFIIMHTEVPERLGGRGIGGQLVRAAIAFAASEGLTVVPWCPYARTWLSDRPDIAAAVEIDWALPSG